MRSSIVAAFSFTLGVIVAVCAAGAAKPAQPAATFKYSEKRAVFGRDMRYYPDGKTHYVVEYRAADGSLRASEVVFLDGDKLTNETGIVLATVEKKLMWDAAFCAGVKDRVVAARVKGGKALP